MIRTQTKKHNETDFRLLMDGSTGKNTDPLLSFFVFVFCLLYFFKWKTKSLAKQRNKTNEQSAARSISPFGNKN